MYWLNWASRKVLSRDPLYLPRRIGYAARKRIVDRGFRIDPDRDMFGEEVPADPAGLIEYFQNRKEPGFHFSAADLEKIVEGIPREEREKTILEGEKILQNQFTFRGIGPVVLDPVDWSITPVPAEFSGWRYDLNRHFYFATLGFAYWYTGDPRYTNKFFELSSFWLKKNPVEQGIPGWDDPFEVAARMNGWIWAYFLFLFTKKWEPGNHWEFLRSLGGLSEYLYRVIEYHNPGNHILLEAKTLALCAGLFPEFLGATKWRRKAWRIIDRELERQVCRDGVHAERSTMYHRIVAGELGELLLFCIRNHYAHDRLRETVYRMAEFLDWVTGEIEESPVLGDGYRQDSYFRFWAPGIARAVCRKEPVSYPESSDLIEQTLWALGTRASAKATEAGGRRYPEALGKDFPEGGYFISRWDWGQAASILVWDCGPVGYRANPYHGHLDALSFVLTVKGIQFLIDPGIDELSIKRNRRLRSTAAHNTVVIDGENQSILASLDHRNEVWSPAEAKLRLWGTCPEFDVMTGEHDGYSRLKHPVLHRRTIISMRGKYWLLVDRLEGEGRHTMEQRFHLAPGIRIHPGFSKERIVLRKQSVALFFYTVPFRGEEPDRNGLVFEEGIAGLFPSRIDPIDVINIKRETTLPLEMAVVLAPEEVGIGKVVSQLAAGEEKAFSVIEIQAKDFKDEIWVGQKMFRDGLGKEWRSDADFVLLRESHQEGLEAWAIGVKRLEREGRRILEEEKRVSIYFFKPGK
jgi:hypothetical protein